MAVDDEVGLGREDAPGGVDVVVTALGAAVLPRSLRKVSGERLETVVALQRAAVRVLDAQADVVALLRIGRDLGLSWDSLGWCIGLSDNGARQMVDRADREAALLEDD